MEERRTILLLTSNEPLADRVRALLEEEAGYRLLVTREGAGLTDLVESQAVEMVLYDAELALEEGPAAAARLRVAHPFLPVIPVTRVLREKGPPTPDSPYAPPDRTLCGGSPEGEAL